MVLGTYLPEAEVEALQRKQTVKPPATPKAAEPVAAKEPEKAAEPGAGDDAAPAVKAGRRRTLTFGGGPARFRGEKPKPEKAPEEVAKKEEPAKEEPKDEKDKDLRVELGGDKDKAGPGAVGPLRGIRPGGNPAAAAQPAPPKPAPKPPGGPGLIKR